MLFPLTTLGTLFLESRGGSLGSFGDTLDPDPLVCQYVTTYRVSLMDGVLIRWGTFLVNYYLRIQVC